MAKVTIREQVADSGHVAILEGGTDIYIYWGDDKTAVAGRARAFEVVLIGANLDTALVWLRRPDMFPDSHERLIKAYGSKHIHFVADSSQEEAKDNDAR